MEKKKPDQKGRSNKMNRQWIQAAVVRAAKTVAQTAIATIGTNALLTDVNWMVIISTSALAGILSILTSVAGLPEVKKEENE